MTKTAPVANDSIPLHTLYTERKYCISSPSRNSHLIFCKRLLVSSLNIWAGPSRKFHTMPLDKIVEAHITKEKGLGWALNHSHTGALCPRLVGMPRTPWGDPVLPRPLSPLPGFSSELVVAQRSWRGGNAPFSTTGFLDLERLNKGDNFFSCGRLA